MGHPKQWDIREVSCHGAQHDVTDDVTGKRADLERNQARKLVYVPVARRSCVKIEAKTRNIVNRWSEGLPVDVIDRPETTVDVTVRGPSELRIGESRNASAVCCSA